MKWLVTSFPIIALLIITGCSRSRSNEGAARAATLSQDDLDLVKHQGTWRIESSTWNGVKEPDVGKSVTILFQGDKFIVVDIDGNRQQETIKLMSSQNPKAIDCTSKGGAQPTPGIYSLEGDTFTWCSAGGANKIRPTAFSSEPGSNQSLIFLRRSMN